MRRPIFRSGFRSLLSIIQQYQNSFIIYAREKSGGRIALMEYWVERIDAQVNLFHDTNIRKAAEITFEQWNKERDTATKTCGICERGIQDLFSDPLTAQE